MGVRVDQAGKHHGLPQVPDLGPFSGGFEDFRPRADGHDLRRGVLNGTAAANQALGQAKEISSAEMGKATAGFNLPGLTS